MYNLIRFIQKNWYATVFVLLEVFCIVLLFTSQPYHKRAWLKTSNRFVGRIESVTSGIGEYFYLGKTNRDLVAENNALRTKLSLYRVNPQMIKSEDTLYEYIPVRVVGNSINQMNNYIIIDKGSKDGIEKNMGLISPQGVAGVVCNVSENYSMAMSLLHHHSSLSVRFKDNRYIANMNWKTSSYRYGNIVDIPSHVSLNEGDTIVTSGLSFIFPPDIVVGVVSDVETGGHSGLKKAMVRFSTDFASLSYAYVVRNTARNELDSLNRLATP